jgi:hypothetical protein
MYQNEYITLEIHRLRVNNFEKNRIPKDVVQAVIEEHKTEARRKREKRRHR